MSKIQKIRFTNFKAIGMLEAAFKGCTAIVTGGNNKGKTSFLRGIPDRCRFLRPEVKVRTGEKEGSGEMVLDTGEKFIWEFDNDGKDKFVYIPEKGKKPESVTVEIGQRFFKPLFDIDKFLASSPKEQVKQLQKIVGVDFTDVDARYKTAYDIRTQKNIDSEKYHVKLSNMLEVPKVDKVDLTKLQQDKEIEEARLETLRLKNKAHNDGLKDKWIKKKGEIDKEASEFNQNQKLKNDVVTRYEGYIKRFEDILNENTNLQQMVDITKLKHHTVHLPRGEANKIAADLYPKEPTYIEEMPDKTELRKIEAEILAASETNTRAQAYIDYINYKGETEAAKEEAETADKAVKQIESERLQMIEKANFPKGVSINADGITVDGLPLDRNQISTSKLYTTALRIASMNLGEVKTLYFDASFLDRNNLAEIEHWANENELQLLIERPDFEGGDIKFELIEN